MNVLLRVSILCLCIYGADTHAGVQEDFPDFFPKEPDKGAEQNGWDLLPSLGKIPPEDREGLPEMFNFDPERLSRLNVKKTRALAERYAENLRILERIMDAPRLKSDQWRTFKINGDGGFDSMKAAITAQLLLCKTVADAREGNAAQGVATGLRVLRFGLKICEAEPLLADLAVSASLINMGAGTVAAMAALPDMDSTALRKAAKDLDACDTAGTVFRQGLKGEARWALSFCEPLLQEGDGRKDTVIELAIAHELMSAIFSEGAEKKKGGSVTEETLREKWKKELPAHVKAALRDADKVDWRAHTQAQAELVRALMKADNRSLPAFKASFHPPDFYVVVRNTALEPYFQSKIDLKTEEFYMNVVAGASARIREARAILLLRAWQLDHQRLPASLDELTPEYWPSVPVDPFDGKPLRYDASTRKVWCVGMNLKDEKGENAGPGKNGPDDSSLTLPKAK